MLGLIGCEYSATVSKAFRARGHMVWSNDILPTEGDKNWHIRGDVREAIASRQWDFIMLHLPCTAMAVCGNSTYGRGMAKHHKRIEAIKWSLDTWELAKRHAPHVALENPASVIFPALRERGALVQYIQPWQHGHLEQKKTGLALHGLPYLCETENVHKAMMELPKAQRERVHYMSPGPDRAKERARFYAGFAAAMADQWGRYIAA